MALKAVYGYFLYNGRALAQFTITARAKRFIALGLALVIIIAALVGAMRSYGWQLEPLTWERGQSLLSASAWPLVVLLLGLVYRRQITELIKRMRSFDVAGVKAEFERELIAASEEVGLDSRPGPNLVGGEVQDALELAQGLQPEVARDLQGALRLAEISPRAAILEAWLLLEAEVGKLLDPQKGRRGDWVYATLAEHSDRLQLTDLHLGAVKRLRHLRNMAAHEPQLDLSPAEATSFIQSILLLVARFRLDLSKILEERAHS